MAASTIVKNFTDGASTGADDTGNSGTVNCAAGDFSVSGLMADGRNVADYESRGSLCSVRKTTRAYPQISFSAHYREAWDASGFKALALGMTAGFVSTLASKGDADAIDITFTSNYDAETHTWVFEDCVATFDFTEGDPSAESYTFDVKGKVSLDGNDVIATP